VQLRQRVRERLLDERVIVDDENPHSSKKDFSKQKYGLI
jgi:hypothetical protein